MKLRIKRLITILIALVLLQACGGSSGGGVIGDGGDGGDDGGDDTAASSLDITLRSVDTNIAARAVAARSSNEQDCVVVRPIGGNMSGACLTPRQISGTVSGISLGRQSGSIPARLLGGGSGLSNGGFIAAQAFDLADPTALEGEDNLEGDTSGETWDIVSTKFYHLDLKFELNGKYWTVRHGFITEPIIEDDVIDACIPFENGDEPGDGDGEQGDNLGGYRQDLIDNGFLIEGASFKKGDLLFCIKDNDSECAVAEFKWFDVDTDSLVNNRPISPRQIQFMADKVTTCEPSNDGQGYNTDLGGFDMFALVTDPFLLSAVFPNSPVKVYTFSNDDGITSVEGSEMGLFVDFDVESSVFFPGVAEADLATMTDEQIAAGVFLKPLYIRENASEGTGYTPGISVGVNAALSGTSPPPLEN